MASNSKKHFVVKLKKPGRKDGDKPFYMECGHLFMAESGGIGTLFWNDCSEEYAVFAVEPKEERAKSEQAT
jgi:hypothetical protein